MPVVPPPSIPGVETQREFTRTALALGSLGGLLLLLVIILLGWIYLHLPIDDVLKVLTTTAGVLTGIVGAIIGFYFRGNGQG